MITTEKQPRFIKLYSKFCVKCVKPQDFAVFEHYCMTKGYRLEVIRTSFDPKMHEEATKIWGSDTYVMFIHSNDTNMDFDYAMEKLKNGQDLFEEDFVQEVKSKPVKRTKKK